MVAPTCDLMSSPTIGTPASVNFCAHSGSDAMKTGSALTKATPASRQHCA
jgi:putative N-acetylmannosamine-6-phosphate epimerase